MSYKKSIDLEYLSKNAFNMRWAEVAPDVIPLTAADSDLPIAKEIQTAIVETAEHLLFPYGPAQGLLTFREAIAQHYNHIKGSQISADQVLAVNSAATALQDWCYHFINEGDEVLIPDPVDFLLGYCAEKAGGLVIRIPAEQYWNEEAWLSQLSVKTKAIFICHPHNPLGFSYSKTDLEKISSFAKKHELLLLSDEVWSDVILTDSFVSMSAIDKDSWVVYGLSKGFGLAGLRIGALIGPSSNLLEVMESQGYARTTQGVSTLSQIAATAALQSLTARTSFIDQMSKNINYVYHRFEQEQQFFECKKPSSTFVIWLKHPAHWDTLELTKRIENEARVKLVPGLPIWFGPGANNHIRMSCATSPEVLEEALNRIIAWTNALPNTPAPIDRL